MDFVEVRSYAAGDDVRTIDWRVTARTNEVHTKVFAEERERPTIVAADLTQSLFFGSRTRLKSLVVAELTARHAWIALAAGDRVGAVIAGNDGVTMHPAKRSVQHVARLLGDVSTVSATLSRTSQLAAGKHPFLQAIERLVAVARSGHRIELVSDFRALDSDWKPALLGLAKGNDVHARIVTDPLEAQLPLRDPASVTDGRDRRLLNTGNERLRQRYSERFDNHRREIASTLTSCGIGADCISTTGEITSAPIAPTRTAVRA